MTRAYIGRWTIARSIVDGAVASEMSCTGSAVLRPDEPDLRYDEDVAFRLAGKVIHATRAYRFAESAGAIVATFSDGSPFYTVRLNAAGVGTAVHHCGSDVYTLTLTLREPEYWQTQWDVSGTKQLRITTHYAR